MRRARDGTLNGAKFTYASSLTPLAVPLLLEARLHGPGCATGYPDSQNAATVSSGTV